MILEDTGHLVSCAFDGKIRLWDWGHEEEVVATTTETTAKKNKKSNNDDEEEDMDHSGHTVLHEFKHPSQFRCLGYYPGLKQILVGTEEANILTFQLPKKKEEGEEKVEGKEGEGKEGEGEKKDELLHAEYESKYDDDEDGGRSPRPGQLSTE